MYPETRSFATLAGAEIRTKIRAASHLFELGVSLDEFLCAAPRKTDGESAVFVIAFDTDDSAHAKVRVANFLTQKGIFVTAALRGGASKRGFTSRAPGCRGDGGWLTSRAAEEFFG